MKDKSLDIFIGDGINDWDLACETFNEPFLWLEGMLRSMTGYWYPSGYA